MTDLYVVYNEQEKRVGPFTDTIHIDKYCNENLVIGDIVRVEQESGLLYGYATVNGVGQFLTWHPVCPNSDPSEYYYQVQYQVRWSDGDGAFVILRSSTNLQQMLDYISAIIMGGNRLSIDNKFVRVIPEDVTPDEGEMAVTLRLVKMKRLL